MQILIENTNIFAICDQSQIIWCSGTSHIIWETGSTNLWPVPRDCVQLENNEEDIKNEDDLQNKDDLKMKTTSKYIAKHGHNPGVPVTD